MCYFSSLACEGDLANNLQPAYQHSCKSVNCSRAAMLIPTFNVGHAPHASLLALYTGQVVANMPCILQYDNT